MGRRGPRARLRPLAAEEEASLARVVRCGSERVDRVRRATALVAVQAGCTFAVAAQASGFGSGRAVGYLVERFNAVGLAALDVAAGRGRKPTYVEAARAQIVATAQREPDRRQDGSATWSLSLLERALRQAGLARIGATTIRRVLTEAGSSYQRTRTWCPTGTAIRKRKAGPVQVVDPLTEQKRGTSTGPIGMPKRQG
jgi:transposase